MTSLFFYFTKSVILLSIVNAYVTFHNPRTCRRALVRTRSQHQEQYQYLSSSNRIQLIQYSTSSSEVEENVSPAAESDKNTTSLKASEEAVEEDEEWEEVEIENLSESDFYNSEWQIGTVWTRDPKKIDETWVRLLLKEGENVAIWGDGAKGKWSVDVPSQFFSVSKETFGGWGGKKLWAGVMEDYYYLDGTVRGWGFFTSASILGQWQMKRLGVNEEERGIAPWFEEGYGEEGEGELVETPE